MSASYHPRYWLSYVAIGFLWLLHWLPLPMLRVLGAGVGRLAYRLAQERRMVALTNLRLCFPDLSETEREALAKRHFIGFCQAFLDRTLIWWSGFDRLRRIIRVKGVEHLHAEPDRPLIILGGHFVALEAGVILLISTQRPFVNVYANQKNPVFQKALLDGRRRYNDPLMLSRQEGMRRVISALKQGHVFHYLPDMDYGPKESIFVPFFSVQAATIPALPRLAKMTQARVVPCVTRLVKEGYEVELLPAWSDFPGERVEEDTRRMNAFIEEQVRRMPEQYFWLHKRFKTRPPGEGRIY